MNWLFTNYIIYFLQPMLRLLRALLSFGTFCGVGIKTTLGMGGLEVKESSRPQ